MKLKRLFALVLVVLMLAGCVAEPATTAPDTAASSATSSTASPSTSVPATGTATSSPTAGTTVPSTTVPSTTTVPPSNPTTETTAPTVPSTTVPSTTAPTVPSTTAPSEDLTPPQTTVPSCNGHASDPYVNVDKDTFYANYTPACCYEDALYRSKHYLMSGSLEVPGQYATVSEYQPMNGDTYIRNTSACYADGGSTYIITDAYGKEVMRIYKGGAYITLEEVAAYVYAFGGTSDGIPANYVSSTSTKPSKSSWGKYLRVNHNKFSGNTSKYPYEPVLPDISGCGGELQYYEMDIGTTGTVTTSDYPVKLYNDGSVITRGAARIVYARQDKNGNGVYEPDEVYVFYTCNHYNDFQEYLNYYGGWGKIFGNITGGGELSSKKNYHPTSYPVTSYADFVSFAQAA